MQNVVLSTLFGEVLRLAHDEPFSGHQGVKKTLQRILQWIWWPTIKDDVAQCTQSRDVCARRMSACPKARAPLKERQQATQPSESIEIDVKGSLPKMIMALNMYSSSKTRSLDLQRCTRSQDKRQKEYVGNCLNGYVDTGSSHVYIRIAVCH